MKIECFFPMIPPTATHQEKNIRIIGGKPVVYEPAKVKTARIKLESNLAKARPASPMQGPVRLVVKWLFPISGTRRDGEYKTTRPDTDNLQKLLKDVMTDLGFWKDDAQVVSEVAEKFWAARPGIYLLAEEVEE